MAGKLENRVTVITGGASGYGREMALLFAHEGARIVLWDINEKGGLETLNLLKEKKKEDHFQKLDVRVSGEVRQASLEVERRFGRLDLLVNNAGVHQYEAGNVVETTEEEYDRVMDTNVKGIFLCSKYLIPLIQKSGNGGAIINIASAAAHTGEEGLADYSACKAGVVGFSKVLAKEVSSYGVNVVTVSPGLTETAVFKQLPREQIEARKQDVLVKRLGQPEDIANLVLFLASDEASYIVGYNYVIDGGGFL